MRRRIVFVALAVAVLGLVAAGAFALKRMMDAPMFEPGSVAERVRARGESLDPAPSDRTSDAWQVAPDVALHHDSFGAGDDVLFVHGGPGLPTRGRPRGLEALAKTHRVHIYDARGCGRSTRLLERAPNGSFYSQLEAVEGALGIAEQIADIERIRRRLGQDRITIVGHSFGALIAALYAAEFGDRVRGLVLVSPAPLAIMPKDGPDLFALVGARLPDKERAAYGAYMKGYFDLKTAMTLDEAALSRRFAEFARYYELARPAEESAPNIEAIEDGDAGGFLTLATYASMGRRHDWRPALARIAARTVVLHGEWDLVPEHETRAFAASIPNAVVEVVRRAGHFGVDEAPDAIVAAVTRAEGR